ncbi:hypothetical protein AMECASPLE_030863, partial [Ameca splendens]
KLHLAWHFVYLCHLPGGGHQLYYCCQVEVPCGALPPISPTEYYLQCQGRHAFIKVLFEEHPYSMMLLLGPTAMDFNIKLRYKHCLTVSPSPVGANGVREKPPAKTRCPSLDGRQQRPQRTRRAASYSSGAKPFVQRANAPSDREKLRRLAGS